MCRFLKAKIVVIDKIIGKIVTFLVLFLLLTVLLQIGYRYIIIKFVQFNLAFTEELSRFLLVWITYLCLGICYEEIRQSSVNIINNKLSKKSIFCLRIFIKIMILIFLYFVVIKGLPFALSTFNFTSPTMRISKFWFYITPVVGCVSLAIHIVLYMIEDFILQKELSYHKEREN